MAISSADYRINNDICWSFLDSVSGVSFVVVMLLLRFSCEDVPEDLADLF